MDDTKQPNLAYLLIAVAGYVGGAIAFGSLFSVWLVELLPADSLLLKKGPGKLTRRVMMLCGLVGLPLFTFAMGSFRKEDHGWTPWHGYTLRRNWIQLLVAGWLLGLATLGTVMLLSLLHGSREWQVAYALPKLALKLLVEYPLKAVVLATFEETVMRGYLLRGLCRRFGVWGAVVLSGGLFALLHFVEPTTASFFGSGIVNDGSRVFVSALGGILREPDVVWKFANLFLMSAFLCLLTLRTGTIWPAVGVHAGWVWVKHTNAVVADANPVEPVPWVFGRSSDHLDALTTSIILGVLCYALGHSWLRARQMGRQREGDPR